MKKLLLFSLLSCCLLSSCDKQYEARHKSFVRATKLINQGLPAQAYALLDTVLAANKGEETLYDSAYFLHADLSEVMIQDRLIAHAVAIQKEKDGWQLLEKDAYNLPYLHYESSISFAKPLLLRVKPSIPELIATRNSQNKRRVAAEAILAKAQAVENAQAAKKTAVAEESINYIKRGEVQAKLRDNFLDKGLDIKVAVSGKRKTRITFTYVLMNAVWSYKMNQAGDISALLDLGFKEIVLTDGYDYRTVWTPKK